MVCPSVRSFAKMAMIDFRQTAPTIYGNLRGECGISFSAHNLWGTYSRRGSGKYRTERRDSRAYTNPSQQARHWVLPRAPCPSPCQCFLARDISPELPTLTCPSHVPVFGPSRSLSGLASAFITPDPMHCSLGSSFYAPPWPRPSLGQTLRGAPASQPRL